LDGSSPLKLAGGRALIEEVLEQRVPYLVGVIANRLVNAGSALCRRHFQIGFPEWRIMVVLALEPAAAKRIGDVVGLDKAAISRGLKALERRGLIRATGETAGRRSRAWLLTDEGRAVYERLLKASREHERRLLAGLDPAEVPILLDMLRRVLAEVPQVEVFDPDSL
jgi:DNA-binding MarR family transcriptional regulator